jgi:hypothetical protein
MCGGDFSVLDIEKFNAFYNCGGCAFGYRFRPLERLTDAQRKDMMPFGYNIRDEKLYLCRAYHQGDIIPGTLDIGGTCYLPWGRLEHQYRGKGVEVFTVPGWGGNSNSGGKSGYKWLPVSGQKTIPANAIAGGRERNGDTTYIGICTLQREGKNTDVIGKIRSSQPNIAYIPFYGQEVQCTQFSILVCG